MIKVQQAPRIAVIQEQGEGFAPHRYWLFGGEEPDISHGFDSFIESHPSIEDAIEAGQTLVGLDWWHIIDIEAEIVEDAIVASSETYGVEGDLGGRNYEGVRDFEEEE